MKIRQTIQPTPPSSVHYGEQFLAYLLRIGAATMKASAA
jgi:hypothetical protein